MTRRPEKNKAGGQYRLRKTGGSRKRSSGETAWMKDTYMAMKFN